MEDMTMPKLTLTPDLGEAPAAPVVVKEEKPLLTIQWSLPLYDIQYEWYPRCGKNRSLRIDWMAPEKSRISSGRTT